MAQLLTRNDLKVDATYLDGSEQNSFLILYNVNVPSRLIFGDPANVAEQVKRFLDVEFPPPCTIYFQLTATYYIVNKQTGFERLWSGSFSPRQNLAARLLPFQNYDNASFVNKFVNACDNVQEKLTWFGRETVWEFDRLESVIVNVQTTAQHGHPALAGHNLRKQKFVTFQLP